MEFAADFEKTCRRMEVVLINDDAVGFFSNLKGSRIAELICTLPN